MPNFLYVLAYLPEGSKKNDPIAFRHWMVKNVRDADQAYAQGMSEHDNKVKGQLLNNYVIKITKVITGE